MKKIYVIYDDSTMPNKEIRTITGEKSYGDTIFKRVTLSDRMKEEILKAKNIEKIIDYKEIQDKENVFRALPITDEQITIVHIYSNFGLSNQSEFQALLTKAEFMNESFTALCGDQPAMQFVESVKMYKDHFDSLVARNFEGEKVKNQAFTDLSIRTNFLNFITGGFDARFFNALAGDEYTVTKRSTKKEKIKAEYEFYYLLPEHMKMWFVMPYDYKEDATGASYTMERYHMTDIAIRYVHGAVDNEELKDILDKLFYFIKERATKHVSAGEGKEIAKDLYIDKLLKRMEELKEYKEYEQFDRMLAMGTNFSGIEAVVEKYKKLYDKLAEGNGMDRGKGRDYTTLAVGHGDLCFSNILYSKEAEVLRLIDPKGAIKEVDLYTDPYYDLAKLSHSICGCYDFFNSGLFDISIGRDLTLKLSIDKDASSQIEIFKYYLEENGFDYALVRLYEASLFLSMLPYHMDQPGKVFGFLLNAITILEEVEKCLQD